ncbi:Regulator of chromosome condensation, RCC1 [Dillenia turbinata]|uniref:Regulator of chromosome condensation, RCC1 n=1 Tax=Dillenia turbinata TaxID=194707 RepID=A0AAN8Z3L6_9MAGN
MHFLCNTYITQRKGGLVALYGNGAMTRLWGKMTCGTWRLKELLQGYCIQLVLMAERFWGPGGGELYTWGSNENGCLGTGCTNATSLPEKVQGPFSRESVSSVSCGWKHTAAISGGNVFTWGWGGANGTFSDDGHSSGGQLGHGNDIDYLGPTLVKFGQNVKALEVSCGFNHSGVILEYVQA